MFFIYIVFTGPVMVSLGLPHADMLLFKSKFTCSRFFWNFNSIMPFDNSSARLPVIVKGQTHEIVMGYK
jgi:hypothetical protein